MSLEIKICGATSEQEVSAVSTAGADLVGLWWGVSGSPLSLPEADLESLADAARRHGSTPCMVTFERTAERIAARLQDSRIRVVQLHGFQPPDVALRLRRLAPAVRILKVLHIEGSTCLDSRWIEGYQRAGVDGFILDAVVGSRVGSTATGVSPSVAATILDRVSLPTLIAGGLGPTVSEAHRVLLGHPRLEGIDVDSAARDCDGVLEHGRARAICAAWRDARASATTPTDPRDALLERMSLR